MSLHAYKSPLLQFSSVQSLSRVRLFATPWTVARQASLSITNSRSLLKLLSIESVMPSNHRYRGQGYGCSLVAEFWDKGEKKE